MTASAVAAVTLSIGENFVGSTVVENLLLSAPCCELFMLRGKVRLLVRFRVTQVINISSTRLKID